MNIIVQTIAKTVITSVLNQSGGQNALVQNVLGMLSQGGQTGGLNNIIQQFQRSGLDDIVASWIGTGTNKPVNAAQIQQALGTDQIQQLAQSSGLSADQAAGQLSSLLPALLDKLTPDGAVDQNMIGQVLQALTASQKAA